MKTRRILNGKDALGLCTLCQTECDCRGGPDSKSCLRAAYIVDSLMSGESRALATIGDREWLSQSLIAAGLDLAEVATAILHIQDILLTSAFEGCSPEELLLAREQLYIMADNEN